LILSDEHMLCQHGGKAAICHIMRSYD
jgi:hypothetical protein